MTPEQQVRHLASRAEALANDDAAVIVSVVAGGDDVEARRVASEIVALAAGEHPWPPSTWWATPLGHLCARWVTPDPSTIVSPTVAAEMLGRSVQRIYQLRTRGVLTAAPGGVTMSSVLLHRARHDPPTTITIDRLLAGLDVDTLLAVREEFELLEPDEPATCEDTGGRELAVTTIAGVAIEAQTAIARVNEQLARVES